MDRLKQYLELLGVDEDWAIDAIRKYLDIEMNKKERAKRYYAKHKTKLKKYHKEYRNNHADYRRKNARRAGKK